MAFGDSGRAQNAIGYQDSLSQNYLDNLRKDTIVPQNQTMWNKYLVADDLAQKQQADIMGGYQNVAGNAQNAFNPATAGFASLAAGGAGAAFDPQFRGGLSSALGGYQNFADTGGLSAQNLQDMRARSVAPLRAAYANASRDIDRQRSLQGGYSPNLTAAKVKMARQMGQGLADASTNVEAGLAEQIRSGKLAGLGGLNTVSNTGQSLQNAIDSINAQTRIAANTGLANTAGMANDTILKALGGASDLYGRAPGAADMASRNVISSTGQQIDLAQLQNQLSLGTMNAQINKGQIPGNFAQGLSAANSILGMAPGVGGLLNQLMNRGGTPIPGRQTTSNSGTMPTGQPMGYPPNFDNTFSGPTSQPPAQQPPTPNVSTSETYNYPGTLGGYDQNGNPEMYNNGYYNDPHEYSYPDDGSLEYRQTTPNYGNLPTGGTGYRP